MEKRGRKPNISLGTLRWPQAELVSYDSCEEMCVIRVTDRHRTIKIKLGVHCATTLVKLAHEMVEKHREHAVGLWNEYLTLKKATGYTRED